MVRSLQIQQQTIVAVAEAADGCRVSGRPSYNELQRRNDAGRLSPFTSVDALLEWQQLTAANIEELAEAVHYMSAVI